MWLWVFTAVWCNCLLCISLSFTGRAPEHRAESCSAATEWCHSVLEHTWTSPVHHCRKLKLDHWRAAQRRLSLKTAAPPQVNQTEQHVEFDLTYLNLCVMREMYGGPESSNNCNLWRNTSSEWENTQIQTCFKFPGDTKQWWTHLDAPGARYSLARFLVFMHFAGEKNIKIVLQRELEIWFFGTRH